MAQKQNYDDVSVYPLDPEMRERLFERQTECSVVWSTTDGWPVGVLHRYVWHEDRFWVTTMEHRKRVPALRRRPKSSIIISGEGVEPGWRDFTVTVKTLSTVHDQGTPAFDEAKEWFYPALALRLTGGNEKAAQAFEDRLDSPGRVIIEMVPEKWITYDGAKVSAHVAGAWEPGQPWNDPRL